MTSPRYAEKTFTISPRAAFDLLEGVLRLVEEAVFDEGGTLERAAGAAALAVWGAPLPCDDDAERAVAAALAIQRGAAGRGFEVSLGVHTGPAAAGTIGAEKALRFVAAGETMELARRVCGAAGAGAILVSAETAAALRGAFTTLPAGQVPRHGAPLDVYRVLPRET